MSSCIYILRHFFSLLALSNIIILQIICQIGKSFSFRRFGVVWDIFQASIQGENYDEGINDKIVGFCPFWKLLQVVAKQIESLSFFCLFVFFVNLLLIFRKFRIHRYFYGFDVLWQSLHMRIFIVLVLFLKLR